MRALRIGGLAAITLLVVYVGVRVSFAARGLADSVCSNPSSPLQGWEMLLACVAAFGAGRLASNLRTQPAVAAPPRRSGGALAAHLALALFFLFAAAALAYESVGVWSQNPWGLQPITHYVRCAKSADPLTTALVAATVSFFAGHWLWFPSSRRGD